MSVTFKQTKISRNTIEFALQQFDQDYPNSNDCENWLDKATYKYALQHNNRLYPCKYILSQATGIPRTLFNGGEQTNRVFQQLGFAVVNK